MRTGLYSLATVAKFLGKRPRDMERMIEEDGLPAVPVPGEEESRYKFAATQLCAWLNARSKGRRWTVEEVIAELDRCEASRDVDDFAGSLALVRELQTLCEAAQSSLSRGQACPNTMKAICNVAKGISTEEAA